MNHVNHPYNKNSSCYNFLFHPLHNKSVKSSPTFKKGAAITFLVIATIYTFGIWQIPFLIINLRDKKKLNLPKKDNTSKTKTVSALRFKGQKPEKNPSNSSSSDSISSSSSDSTRSSSSDSISSSSSDSTRSSSSDSISSSSSESTRSSSSDSIIQRKSSLNSKKSHVNSHQSNADSSVPPLDSLLDSAIKENVTDNRYNNALFKKLLTNREDIEGVLANNISLLSCLADDTVENRKSAYQLLINYRDKTTSSNSIYSEKVALLSLIDHPLLIINLKSLINPKCLSHQDKMILRNPDRKNKIELIQTRIQQLDEAIQLKKRIEELDPLDLKVEDLFTPWNTLYFLYKLVMDDELAEIKASDFPPDFYKFVPNNFKSRFKKVATEYDFDAITAADLRDIPAAAFCKLDVLNANRLMNELPPIALFLMPISENLNVATLSENQANALFAARENVSALQSNQIEDCLAKVDKQYLDFLADKQIIKLNYSKLGLKGFNLFFNIKNSRMKELLQGCKLKRIYTIQEYFKKEHWWSLSDDQVLNFDFSKIDKIIFSDIFSLQDRAKRLFPLYDQRIYEICKYFEKEHWRYLSDEQILGLDFSKIDQKVFKILFHPVASRTKKLLQACDIDKLKELVPYLNHKHHKLLLPTQFQALFPVNSKT